MWHKFIRVFPKAIKRRYDVRTYEVRKIELRETKIQIFQRRGIGNTIWNKLKKKTRF